MSDWYFLRHKGAIVGSIVERLDGSCAVYMYRTILTLPPRAAEPSWEGSLVHFRWLKKFFELEVIR